MRLTNLAETTPADPFGGRSASSSIPAARECAGLAPNRGITEKVGRPETSRSSWAMEIRSVRLLKCRVKVVFQFAGPETQLC
jgi:hypothetical protein